MAVASQLAAGCIEPGAKAMATSCAARFQTVQNLSRASQIVRLCPERACLQRLEIPAKVLLLDAR